MMFEEDFQCIEDPEVQLHVQEESDGAFQFYISRDGEAYLNRLQVRQLIKKLERHLEETGL